MLYKKHSKNAIISGSLLKNKNEKNQQLIKSQQNKPSNFATELQSKLKLPANHPIFKLSKINEFLLEALDVIQGKLAKTLTWSDEIGELSSLMTSAIEISELNQTQKVIFEIRQQIKATEDLATIGLSRIVDFRDSYPSPPTFFKGSYITNLAKACQQLMSDRQEIQATSTQRLLLS